MDELPMATTLSQALPETLIHAMETRFGRRFTTTAAIRHQHGHSETHFEALPPDAVVFPHMTAEVQEIVRLCARHRTPIIPFGAGTSI